jgi:hypothetical protein
MGKQISAGSLRSGQIKEVELQRLFERFLRQGSERSSRPLDGNRRSQTLDFCARK